MQHKQARNEDNPSNPNNKCKLKINKNHDIDMTVQNSITKCPCEIQPFIFHTCVV